MVWHDLRFLKAEDQRAIYRFIKYLGPSGARDAGGSAAECRAEDALHLDRASSEGDRARTLSSHRLCSGSNVDGMALFNFLGDEASPVALSARQRRRQEGSDIHSARARFSDHSYRFHQFFSGA